MPEGTSKAPKRDLYREHREEYVAPRHPVLRKVGPARYLVVPGRGAPGGPEFTAAIAALFPTAYSLKFLYKDRGRDYKVSGLEGLWDVPPLRGPPTARDMAKMEWRLVLRVPEFVTGRDLKAVARRLAAKGTEGAARVRLETLREGTCVQMLHVGPYAKEHATVEAMQTAARTEGFTVVGPLHEIYRSDPRRVAPSRLKTILRFGLRKSRAR